MFIAELSPKLFIVPSGHGCCSQLYPFFSHHILSGDGFLLSWGGKAGTKLTEFCFFRSDPHPAFPFELGQEKIKFLTFPHPPHPQGNAFLQLKILGIDPRKSCQSQLCLLCFAYFYLFIAFKPAAKSLLEPTNPQSSSP